MSVRAVTILFYSRPTFKSQLKLHAPFCLALCSAPTGILRQGKLGGKLFSRKMQMTPECPLVLGVTPSASFNFSFRFLQLAFMKAQDGYINVLP